MWVYAAHQEKQLSERKKIYVGSEALPTSNKERKTPRAEAPWVLLTSFKSKGLNEGQEGA